MIKNNLKSIAVAVVILYLSVAESDNLIQPPLFFNFAHMDKVIHFGMYFTLMFVIIYENRFSFNRKKYFFLIGLIPFLYGGLMELCQKYLTATRSADIFDLAFNTLGIIFAAALWKYVIFLKTNSSD